MDVQGGTALRILYGLPRFSEDLDFILKTPDPTFNWSNYANGVQQIFEEFGITPTIVDKIKTNTNIKKLFFKDNSIGKVLNLIFTHHPHQNIVIKLEIDIHPPAGSIMEVKYCNFPLLFPIEAQDLASNFSGKSHALLCRGYLKGRDWYDFLWYVSKKIKPNLELFENAIHQTGPWQGQSIHITPIWYLEQLKEKINQVDWTAAAADVERFLNRS